MHIIEKAETASTNDDAKLLAESGAAHLTVVWAHRQTAGRGRHGRKWISADGNVFWSIILRPNATWPTISDIVFVNALAVHRAISRCAEGNISIFFKWPNDIIINGHKVCGSLIETSGYYHNGIPDWIVIGIGINVTSHPDQPSLKYPPSSLHSLGYFSATRDDLIHYLNAYITEEVNYWLSNGFRMVRDRYLRHAYQLNEEIIVGNDHDKNKYTRGFYRGVDLSGHLILETSTGKQIKFSSGDVIVDIKDH